MNKLLLLSTSLFISLSVISQDPSNWNEFHNRDVISAWKNNFTFSTKFMGPNSLPVPEIFPAEFSDHTELELGLQQHLSEGDKTLNILSDILFPIVPGRAGLKIHYVPVEFYTTDTLTRHTRAAMDDDTRGHSFGDVYFSTLIQVIKNHEKMPDLLLTVNIKTASGTNLENARHTDTPGYYFDISLGKTFLTETEIMTSWRPYFMGGFYAYQTNRSKLLQNDAVMFGLGIIASTPWVQIDNKIGGYLGYFGNGDQPVVYRLNFSGKTNSLINYKLGFQFGIHDVTYNTVSLSAVFKFENMRLFWGKVD